ncbi:alpha-hydroxy acid oxidase [Nocardia sp. NPDC049707]|uniref:alpha-hydroxy acid oxidase n=1 Tax=Nocardia sp. NPDC049707 TaxID=3154735 RepID=UPI0034172380
MALPRSPRLTRRLPRPAELAPLLKFKSHDMNATRRRLSRVHTIDDLRRLARRRTPAGPFDYVDGAAEQEVSLERVRRAFRELEFQPRILRDVSTIDTSVEVLGIRAKLPFGLAPTGFTRMMHTAGETAVARAAAEYGVPYTLSSFGTTSYDAVQEAAPNGDNWFQLYLLGDRERSIELVTEAAAAGCTTLFLTVDVPVPGRRLRDLRNGMTVPPQLTPRTLLNASYRPAWWFNFLTTEPLSFAYGSGDLDKSALTGMLDSSVTFDDLAWMREHWPGKLVVKGIQTVDDAVKAVDHGADAIVLSIHGGRQLDRAPVPLHVLPAVAATLRGRSSILLDSGITNGADIVAALALGADFTLVGRAYLYGLMAAGEAGVRKCIEILASEVESTMALIGAKSVDELCPEHVKLLPNAQ